MKTGFKDPIKDKEPRAKKNPWNFEAPQYDQRSGCFVEAGDDHGIGHRQPVGRQGNPKSKVEVLPYGRKQNTQETDYIHHGSSYQIDINH